MNEIMAWSDPLDFNAQLYVLFVSSLIPFMLGGIQLSSLIPFMLGGIQYFLNNMKKIFLYLDEIFDKGKNNIYMSSKKRFTTSYWRYILIVSIIIPFYLIDWIFPFSSTSYEHFIDMYLLFYNFSPTMWRLAFDIYILILGFIPLLLLSSALWIMLNITWTLLDSKSISCSSTNSVYNIKVKIAFIKNIVLRILTYYFFIISLAVISYLNPIDFYSKETAILLILLLIGVLFFFSGLDSLKQIFQKSVEHELDGINNASQEYIERLKTIGSIDSPDAKEDVNLISNVLNVFQKQREQLEQMNTNVYDIRSSIRFISSLLLPIITKIATGVSDALNQELVSKVVLILKSLF